MDETEINKRIEANAKEREELQRQMDRLDIVRERNPGEPPRMANYSGILRHAILRKRDEVLELESANLHTYKEVGKYPQHFNQEIAALREEIRKDEEELKKYS